MNIQENILLKDYTTFKIGGLAKFFCIVKTEEDFKTALDFANKSKLQILILGAGSNLLISDEGFNGLVIINLISGIKIVNEQQGLIEAGSGENWDSLVEFAVSKDFGGAECLSGIPGTVGGLVVQNAGAYGQSSDSLVYEIIAFDILNGTKRILTAKECNFTYRSSIFKESKNLFIVKAVFKFSRNPKITLNYHDLINYFKDNLSPSIVELRSAILKIRSDKGYVISKDKENFLNAGSFYKNPVVPKEVLEKAKAIIEKEEDVSELKARPYYWDLGNGKFKLAAAKLLQSTGFKKGYTLGQVGISPKHSLSLINLGNARAVDIWNLNQAIKSAVLQKFGVKLEEEVIFIGEF